MAAFGQGPDGAKVPQVFLVRVAVGGELLVVRVVVVAVGVAGGPALVALDELGQVGRAFGAADPGVLEEVFGRWALSGLFTQAELDEVFELRGKVAFECWGDVFGDEEEDFHWVDVGVRGFAVGELEGGDAEGPDVCFVVVPGLLDDFGCHPERCADKGVLLGHGCRELTGDAKVGKLDLAIRAKQDVCSYSYQSACLAKATWRSYP